MFQGLVDAKNLNFLLVFLEGLLSFFSPCILPLLPVYIGYLAGGTKTKQEDGTITYERKRVFLHTVCFIGGISATFFILGFSAFHLGGFFTSNKTLFSRIGGIIIIMLGLVQVGFLEIPFLKKEHRVRLKLDPRKMNPLVAFAMGFTFSFAWTPCIGPMLSSVLLLVSSAQDSLIGTLLILMYSLGFVIPFLVLGLFTSQVLNFLKTRRKMLQYTIKIGGVILIIMGVMTFTGWLNGISGYLNKISSPPQKSEQKSEQTLPQNPQDSAQPPEAAQPPAAPAPAQEPEIFPAYDFTLTDQYGQTHTLSEYKGKVVFLNLWATWCGYCEQEMPDIEALYNEYGKNQKDVIFLGLNNPKTPDNSQSVDSATQTEVEAFLTDGGYTFPVVFDLSGEDFAKYFQGGLPATYMIDKEGNIFGWVSGAMTKDMMKSVIDQTLAGKIK